MRADVLMLDPASYRCHPLHGADRVWEETNCAADLWIEALHAMGFDPVAGLGFALGSDFDGDQWRMFTYPAETLRSLYGVEADELNVWRPLREHVAEQLSLGNVVAFDADAWWLPDTAGLTYRTAHQKTTILAAFIDTDLRRLGYLHNAGYFELEGADFEALLPTCPASDQLPPYTLQVRLAGRAAPGPADQATALRLAATHLRRRPVTNPVLGMAARVGHDLARLREDGLDAFHRWAFGTLRQCGANAELAASFATWLEAAGVGGASDGAGPLEAVAVGIKSAEMTLARAVRGRPVNVDGLFVPLASSWSQGIDAVAAAVAAAGDLHGDLHGNGSGQEMVAGPMVAVR
jgi:Domain of unknown function (DUF1839)